LYVAVQSRQLSNFEAVPDSPSGTVSFIFWEVLSVRLSLKKSEIFPGSVASQHKYIEKATLTSELDVLLFPYICLTLSFLNIQ
jgi:hypothetical protein